MMRYVSAPFPVARVWSFSLASRLPSRPRKTPKKTRVMQATAGVQFVHAPLIQSILSNKGLLSAVVNVYFLVLFIFIDLFFFVVPVFVATTAVVAFVVEFALGPVDISKCNLKVIP